MNRETVFTMRDIWSYSISANLVLNDLVLLALLYRLFSTEF